MSAKVLDGKWVRDQILSELRPRIERITKQHRPPGLAVGLVGNDRGFEPAERNRRDIGSSATASARGQTSHTAERSPGQRRRRIPSRECRKSGGQQSWSQSLY